jgi:hypothetical protein
VLVLHSASDEHIPVAQARRIFERAPRPKAFVSLSGPHDSQQWRQAPEVRAAWNELLAGPGDRWPA